MNPNVEAFNNGYVTATYNIAYNTGYNNGYTVGYNNAYTYAYDSGFSEGYQAALEQSSNITKETTTQTQEEVSPPKLTKKQSSPKSDTPTEESNLNPFADVFIPNMDDSFTFPTEDIFTLNSPTNSSIIWDGNIDEIHEPEAFIIPKIFTEDIQDLENTESEYNPFLDNTSNPFIEPINLENSFTSNNLFLINENENENELCNSWDISTIEQKLESEQEEEPEVEQEEEEPEVEQEEEPEVEKISLTSSPISSSSFSYSEDFEVFSDEDIVIAKSVSLPANNLPVIPSPQKLLRKKEHTLIFKLQANIYFLFN